MKELLAHALCAVGMPAWARRRRRNLLPILMYHGVVERPLAPACWHQLDASSFRRQMEWVSKRYQVLPLAQALQDLRSGTLRPRSLAITFDDGYRNVRTVAGPVLEALRLPATVFLVTDFMGTDETLWPDRLYLAFARTEVAEVNMPDLGLVRRPLVGLAARASAYATSVRVLKGLPTPEKDARMTALLAALRREGPEDPGDFRILSWDDVAAMKTTGLFEWGGHSTRHEILARMPDGHVASAIGRSHETVASRTGTPPAVFAYPNGRAMDFDDRSRAALTHLGLRFALSTIEGFSSASSDLLALPRLSIGSDLSFARFRLLISGALESLRGRRE
jgi:peptidoglycan/xylan/chitin deacetylase (PgdA/CDA1 family)